MQSDTAQGQPSCDRSGREDDLATTYRRSPARSGPLTGGHPDLNAMARRVIDANHYMTLATTGPGGRPRLSPVYYTPDDLRGGALRRYVAHTRSCEVHVAAHHPVRGRGTDTRQQADPASAR